MLSHPNQKNLSGFTRVTSSRAFRSTLSLPGACYWETVGNPWNQKVTSLSETGCTQPESFHININSSACASKILLIIATGYTVA